VELGELLHNWYFRFVIIGLFVTVMERITPWRKNQNLIRPLLAQDIGWLVVNIYLFGLVAGPLVDIIDGGFDRLLETMGVVCPRYCNLLSALPLVVQVLVILVFLDFVEWGVHNLLHRVSFLWKFHRVHHSISIMDWIGNFRFHPLELLFYHLFKYVPGVLLGASSEAVMISGTFALLIGCLNHANLKISWGPFKYVLNSPVMHLWHHDARVRGSAGVNFGVVFSSWDYLFGTAFMPKSEVPDRIGFEGDEVYPRSFARRLLVPLLDK